MYSTDSIQSRIKTAQREGKVKAEMKIGGMTCAMCASAVEKTLGQLRGVESVTVNLGSMQTYGKNSKNGVRFMEFVKFKDLTPYFPNPIFSTQCWSGSNLTRERSVPQLMIVSMILWLTIDSIRPLKPIEAKKIG